MTTRFAASPLRLLAGALAAAALFSVPATFAEPPAAPSAASLPSASEVIEKYLKAIGGRDAVQSKTARHAQGTIAITGDTAVPSEVETFAAAPDKLVYVAGGQFSSRKGYDGKTGWIINRATGPMMLGGKRLEEFRDQADFYSTLHDPTKFLKMETVAIADFEGAPCHKLRLLGKAGNEVFEYYDVKTGLLAGSTLQREMEGMAPADITVIQADYKPFDGLLMPTRIIQRGKTAGMATEIVTTITSYEFKPIDPAIFELPPEIKAQIVDQPKGLLHEQHEKEKQQKQQTGGAPK